MAFHYSRRKLKVREEEESGELNIVPYLDILMNLIIFMLLSITGLATFGILNVNAPSYGAPSAGVTQEGADEPEVLLSVLISKQGHFVSSENVVLKQDGADPNSPTIPMKADGTHDFTALTAYMVDVKAAVSLASKKPVTKVIVAADSDIPYETLIQTLDAIRETPGKDRRLLFPDVTLAGT